jgi:polar amino acid transport system permease protein
VLFAPRGCRASSELAWWLAAGFAAGLLAVLLLGQGDVYVPLARFLSGGLWTTLKLVAASLAGSLVIGAVVGCGRVSAFRPFNLLSTMYVEVVRGVPLLVILFMMYYGLNQFLPVKLGNGWEVGWRLDAFWAAVVSFSLVFGAFTGEVIRAGIESIPPEEIEAASLVATRWQSVRFVILPRAVRTILPAIGNEVIALLKDSSLVAILALKDITRAGQEYAQTSFLYFETYLMVALFYLVMTLALSRVVRWVETHLAD